MVRSISRFVGITAGAWGLVVTAAIFILPLYEGVSVTVTSTGERIEQHSRQTLLQVQQLAPITIGFFSVMVLLSLVVLLGSSLTQREWHRRIGFAVIASGSFLLLGSVISGFSVGAFYLPGALLALGAGALLVATPQPK